MSKILEEIVAGEGITLSQAASILPAHRGGGRTSPSAIWRAIKTGCKSPTGEIVKLAAARFGSRYLTSRGAIQRYMEALTGTDLTPALTPPRSPSARAKACAAASVKLQAMGA